MAFLRTVVSRGHRYRQRVEWYRDSQNRKRRLRILENLGPVNPLYRRPTPAPTLLPMEPIHFGLLATRMMSGTVTAAHVIQTVQEMGVQIPPGDLSAVGIRFDLREKTFSLLLWLTPPSPDHPPAKSAKRQGRSKGTENPPRSSRSKAVDR